jgi:hypothetical protein
MGEPVDGWPGWYWWHGVAGLLYARRLKTSPPWVVRAHNKKVLRERIEKKEARLGEKIRHEEGRP